MKNKMKITIKIIEKITEKSTFNLLQTDKSV